MGITCELVIIVNMFEQLVLSIFFFTYFVCFVASIEFINHYQFNDSKSKKKN